MDEGVSAHKQPTTSPSNKHSFNKQRAGLQKYSHQANKFKSKFRTEQKWSLLEKTRLLEALKRYDAHNISSIATLVETKSEEEVEERIKAYKGANSFLGTTDRVDGPGTEKAPIEDWIDLVQEMTKLESADYTQFVPKVLGLITRNEKFADSGVPHLKWRNIYQFLTDLTEDRAEKQKLSDIESLVVLDMMHSIGDTLLKSDTSQQKHILNYKYNLLNFRSDNPRQTEKMINNQRIAQALSNDFLDIPENVQGTLSDKPSSSASSLPMDGALSGHNGENSLNKWSVINMTSQSLDGTSYIRQRPETDSSTSFTVSYHSMPGTSDSTNSPGAGQQSSTGQSSYQNINKEGSGSMNHNLAESNHRKSSPKTRLLNSHQAKRKFVRPKYFTLNPLCVPTQRLVFKPKSNI